MQSDCSGHLNQWQIKLVSLPRIKMDTGRTYQQDTTGIKNLLKSVPQKNNLNIDRKPLSVMDIPERQREVKEQPAPKTDRQQQIRNWRARQENKLLVDSSKFIRSRSDLQFSSSQPVEGNLVLPIREKLPTGTDWLTIVLFGAIVLFATIRYSYIKYIKHLFTSLVNYPTSVRLLQDSNYPASHAAYRLDVIFYLTFSIFVYQVFNHLEWAGANYKILFFAWVAAGVLLYFIGKKLLFQIAGLLFETQSETSEFLFNVNNFNRSLGLVLLPMVILIAFSPLQNTGFLIFAGTALVLAYYLLLLQRGIFILLRKQFSIYYLFLYLCTLEFLPLLLIYKVVVVE